MSFFHNLPHWALLPIGIGLLAIAAGAELINERLLENDLAILDFAAAFLALAGISALAAWLL